MRRAGPWSHEAGTLLGHLTRAGLRGLLDLTTLGVRRCPNPPVGDGVITETTAIGLKQIKIDLLFIKTLNILVTVEGGNAREASGVVEGFQGLFHSEPGTWPGTHKQPLTYHLFTGHQSIPCI